MTYEIAKALHVIAVISWMAGLLYLPRLYVYHTSAEKGSDLDQTLQTMERKLLRYIMNPAMFIVWGLGIWLIFITGYGGPGTGGWMHAKILLVLFMSGAHGMMASYRRKFEEGINVKSAKFFRIFNEVPTVLMIGIVFLVYLKPF